MKLSVRFEQALAYTCLIHAGQKRKGTQIPYVAHLLSVAAIALEYGADEDEAIAALLHDAVEDAGGKTRLEDIACRFGNHVAEVVDRCTDADVIPNPRTSFVRSAADVKMMNRMIASSVCVSCSTLYQKSAGMFAGFGGSPSRSSNSLRCRREILSSRS